MSSTSAIDPATLVEHFPDALLIVDAKSLRVLAASRAAATFLGRTRAELEALALADVVEGVEAAALPASGVVAFAARAMPRDAAPIEAQAHVATARGVVLVVLRPGRDPARMADDLREANRFLEAVVENIPDMIFVKRARDHMFIRFNRAGEELLGWTRSELLGKTDHDFYPKEEADFFHAKDRETFDKRELVDVAEEPITTKYKGLRWLHTKKVPVYDEEGRPLYLLGISEDITQRKLTEEQLRAVERELASVVQVAADAVVTWTPGDGKIVSWNPAAVQLYGVPAARAVGESIDLIVPEGLRASLGESVAALLAGQRVPIAETYRLRGGAEIEVEESLSLIPGSGEKPPRIASIARDIGEIARLRRAAELLGNVGSTPPAAEDEVISPATRELYASVDVVARDAFASMLLLGETGVGKSWLARRIHKKSPRADKPFFEINCASLAPQMLESELFGHERGAFTGATSQKRGLVEVASGGTLFLDEIGELPMPVQAQILTFLDDHKFRRVGGTRMLDADVRVLAATNVDLADRAAKGTFRKDLYYRLSVVPVVVPPLRDRREEIPALARRVLRDLAARAKRPGGATLGRGVGAALERYDWPGNVRELRNALERALILSRGEGIELAHLPPEIRGSTSAGETSQRLDDVERAHLLRVLESVGGNRTRAAEVLGISRSTLKRKLAELRVPVGDDDAS